MWSKIADFILRFRLLLIIIVGLLTVMMLFLAEWRRAYDYAALVPQSDPEMQFLQSFRKKYGEDGNILAIGIKDEKFSGVCDFVVVKFFKIKVGIKIVESFLENGAKFFMNLLCRR